MLAHRLGRVFASLDQDALCRSARADAATSHRRALQERPHAAWILRNLVSALVAAGRMDEAAVEFKALMIAYPGLTVTKLKKALVFSPAVMDRMAHNMKKAGLPD